MPALTTTAIVMGAIAAVGVGAQVHAADRARAAGNKAFRLQQSAQNQALATAIKQQREQQMAQNKASAKQPDISKLVSDAEKPNSTMLTGPGGVDPSKLTLGGSPLLGG